MITDLADTAANILKVGLGAALGYYVGSTRNEAREARREAHEVEEELHRHEGEPPPQKVPVQRGPKGEPGKDKDTPFERRMLAVVVLIVAAYATYFATSANSKLDRADERLSAGAAQRATLDREVACINRIVGKNTDAQKARSVFALQQAEVNLNLYNAILDPKATPAQIGNALKIAKKATQEAIQVASDNPFPPIADVRDCLKPKPEGTK